MLRRLQPGPRSTRVWEQGASSERIVGARLDRIDGIEVLHDRQIPGTRANIDHIAIGPGGVYVIGTKLARIGYQVDAIRRVLRETPIPVTAGLCIVEARWPVPARPFMIDGVWVGWPDALPQLVEQVGFLDAEARKTSADLLDARLPRS